MKTVQETIGAKYIAVDSNGEPLKAVKGFDDIAHFYYASTVAVMLENNAYRIFAEFMDGGEHTHLFKSWAFGKWVSVMNPDIHLEIDRGWNAENSD